METIVENGALKSKGRKEKMRKKNKKPKQNLERNCTVEQVEGVNADVNFTDEGKLESDDELSNLRESKREEIVADEEKQEEGEKGDRPSSSEKGEVKSKRERAEICKEKKRKRLLEDAAKAEKRGICYLSRIPPHMDHVKLRHILSQYGEIQRIYLAPENPAAQVQRKRAGGFRGQGFSEGWVEFTDKRIAKRVANMLNGEQIGGRKRSSFYYDIWNIKYLSKFKWDDLTEEIAYKNAIREQKLALELSAAKRERDFYLSKVDQSRALSSIKERMKKKQKMVQQDSGEKSDGPTSQPDVKVIRQFPQTKPVAVDAPKSKPRLSRDLLAGVFGGS